MPACERTSSEVAVDDALGVQVRHGRRDLLRGL